MKSIEDFSNNKKLLLVDDDITSINYLESILSRKYPKTSINVVYNANDVFEAINYSKPDLILLDVNLPDGDGYEICKKIKENLETNDIIIIFITANSSYEHITNGFKIGGNDYLIKPYNNEVLFARINIQLKIKHSISLLKEQNMLLKVADERYKQIVENNTYAIIETDFNFNIKFYNKNFKVFFQASYENKLTDINLFEALNIENKTKEIFINKVKQHVERFDIKYQIKKHKQEIVLNIDKINKYDKEGNLIGYFFIFEDITELSELYDKLEKANFVIGNSDSILFIWKPQEGWPVEYVSENISQYGYNAEEFLSENLIFEDIIHSDDKQKIIDEVAFYTKSESVTNFEQEYRIYNKNGNILWINDKTNIVRNAQGGIEKLIGVVVDITEKKKQQEIINKFQKNKESLLKNELETKEKELSSFLIQINKTSEQNAKTVEILSNILANKHIEDSVRKEIKALINVLKKENTQSTWDELKYMVEGLHSDFYRNILTDYPNLTKTELKLCTFLKLAMSSKEIANITFITPDSIKTARTRLRKKFNLQKNDSLTKFLSKY